MQKELRFVSRLVKSVLRDGFAKAFPGLNVDVIIQNEMRNEYDYLCPSAIKYYSMNLNKKEGQSLGCKSVKDFAEKVISSLPGNHVISKAQTNDKGFIQVWLHDQLIEE
jgi:hypothetical protein